MLHRPSAAEPTLQLPDTVWEWAQGVAEVWVEGEVVAEEWEKGEEQVHLASVYAHPAEQNSHTLEVFPAQVKNAQNAAQQ